MSFSFAFDDEDIEGNADSVESQKSDQVNVGQQPSEAIAPRKHGLKSLLETLPSKISYSTIHISGHGGFQLALPRRELFDVRAQLMAEDQAIEQSIIAGLSTDDITPDVYEGGFKTWECSTDLASHVRMLLHTLNGSHEGEYHFIEVGAGTALPTLVILQHFLKHQNPAWSAIQLSVADYNQSVLETTTIPNLLLTWYFASSITSPPREGDLEITEELLCRFQRELSERAIHISGISGVWSDAFSTLLVPFDGLWPRTGVQTFFLASETIYSPSSTSRFAQLLVRALRNAESTGGRAAALVAAKRVYFGVGGGVDEFLDVLTHLGGLSTVVWESTGPGISRVIMEINDSRQKGG